MWSSVAGMGVAADSDFDRRVAEPLRADLHLLPAGRRRQPCRRIGEGTADLITRCLACLHRGDDVADGSRVCTAQPRATEVESGKGGWEPFVEIRIVAPGPKRHEPLDSELMDEHRPHRPFELSRQPPDSIEPPKKDLAIRGSSWRGRAITNATASSEPSEWAETASHASSAKIIDGRRRTGITSAIGGDRRDRRSASSGADCEHELRLEDVSPQVMILEAEIGKVVVAVHVLTDKAGRADSAQRRELPEVLVKDGNSSSPSSVDVQLPRAVAVASE